MNENSLGKIKNLDLSRNLFSYINLIDHVESNNNKNIYSIVEYVYKNQPYALVSGCGGVLSIWNFVCVNGIYSICTFILF